MKNKKGQGISIETIIITIIALVVLVLLIAIFVGQMGRKNQDIGNVESGAYACMCVNPTDKNDDVCGVSAPAPDWNDKSIPLQCGGKFNDCTMKCFTKAPQ